MAQGQGFCTIEVGLEQTPVSIDRKKKGNL